MIHEQLDRQRVERLGRQWFAVDGTNLWPTLVLVVFTGLVHLAQAETSIAGSNGFIANVLLFESASLAALTSSDLRALFLLASGVSVHWR